MKQVAYFVCTSLLLSASFTPIAYGQVTNAEVRPRQPGGLLGNQLGEYRTIEGIGSAGIKVETGTLMVDTVDGKKLEQPIALVIRRAVAVDHNLQYSVFKIPPNQRCILKGFESGEMIGVPPAVSVAAKELGWKQVPMSPTQWRWRPYFVALAVVEPKDLQLNQSPNAPITESNSSASLPVPDRVSAKLSALVKQFYPNARLNNEGVNGIHVEHEVATFEFPIAGPKGAKRETVMQRGPKRGGILCSAYSHQGQYMGQLSLLSSEGRVAQSLIDRKEYKQLLMAPYSQKSNVHLWITLSFPPDVDEAFLEKLQQIMIDFEKDQN